MRELTYFVACSVDGFIARADGSHDGFAIDADYLAALFAAFPETCPAPFREVMGLQNQENQRFDTVLMGRKTYEVGLKDGLTNPYPHLQQLVFSRSLGVSPDENVELVAENAVERTKSLKDEAGNGIWLCGGGILATVLLEAGLIDRLILKINPFLMGTGIPLFAGTIGQIILDRGDRQEFANGVSLLEYRIAP